MFACKIIDPNLPSIRFDANSQGGVDFYVESLSGDGRFMSLNPAGGHYELTAHKSLPDGTHLQLDESGYVTLNKD